MTLDLLFGSAMQPFTVALGVVFAMLILEVLLMLAGISLFGGESDASLDAEPGLDAETDFDIGDALDAEPGIEGELDGVEAAGSGGIMGWLGLGDAPFAIWLAGFLTAFGLTGYALQAVLNGMTGAPLAALPATLVALVPALAIAGRFAKLIGRIAPKFESTAISSRSYGGRRGVITVGTARRGSPAQARLKDGYGNTHYAMVEPLKDDDAFPQGTEIATIRLKDGALRAIGIDDT